MKLRKNEKSLPSKKTFEKKETSFNPCSTGYLKQKILQYDYIFLFFACFFIFNIVSQVTITSSDVAPATFIPAGLILNHDFYFDYAPSMTSDPILSYAFLYQNGHYVSLFPVVTPVLVTPVYLLSYILCNLFNLPISSEDFIILGKTSATIITSLATVIFYFAAKEIFSRKTAIMTAGIFAFATSTWSISSQALWQTGMVELLLIALIWIVIKDARQSNIKNIVLLGILSGLFFFNRPPDALLLIPVIAYIFLYHRERIGHYFIASFAGGLPFLAYNLALFGNFLGGYKENIGRFLITPEIVKNFTGLILAPNVGILVFSPVIILSVIGFCWLRDVQNTDIQRILFILGPVIVLHILLYSSFDSWFSASAYCYGPRYLTGIVPVLCLYIGVFLTRISGWDASDWHTRVTKGITTVLIVISIIIQIIGVIYYPYNLDKTTSLERTWDPADSLIIESYVTGSQEIEKITIYTLPPIPPLFSYTFDRVPGK